MALSHISAFARITSVSMVLFERSNNPLCAHCQSRLQAGPPSRDGSIELSTQDPVRRPTHARRLWWWGEKSSRIPRPEFAHDRERPVGGAPPWRHAGGRVDRAMAAPTAPACLSTQQNRNGARVLAARLRAQPKRSSSDEAVAHVDVDGRTVDSPSDSCADLDHCAVGIELPPHTLYEAARTTVRAIAARHRQPGNSYDRVQRHRHHVLDEHRGHRNVPPNSVFCCFRASATTAKTSAQRTSHPAR